MATIIRFIIRIYFLSPHAFISRRDLPRVAPRKGPISSPVHFLHLRLRVCSPQPPLPCRCVRVVARGPSFLIDDLNFRIYSGSQLRFVRFDVSSHDPFFDLARSFFLSFSQEPSCPRYYRDSSRGRLPFSFIPPKWFGRKSAREGEGRRE